LRCTAARSGLKAKSAKAAGFSLQYQRLNFGF
jgi:hypothetical protein